MQLRIRSASFVQAHGNAEDWQPETFLLQVQEGGLRSFLPELQINFETHLSFQSAEILDASDRVSGAIGHCSRNRGYGGTF